MGLDVALVAMPFAPIQTPSLGLGLLHGAMRARSISTKTFNFSLQFAKQIGTSLYDQISDGEPARTDLVGDWVFNGHLFDVADLDIDGYVRDVLRGQSAHHRVKRFRSETNVERWIEDVLRIRDKTGPFLDECTESLLSHSPRLVGITSMFEEHVGALALAKRIKLARQETFVIVGGSNCEGAMGLETARQFPFVDVVVSGEGDLIFADLVERLLEGRALDGLRGVYAPALLNFDGQATFAPPVDHMDDLPYPDFDDYFEQLENANLDFADIAPPHLLFETARGCWWGQVNHCTFCGLNGATMAFRSKSAARALDELTYLLERHPGYPVAVSDNILDYKYLKDFVPALIERNPGAKLFYEVKSNLRKEDVRALRDAGIDRIQPGIESFSTPILKLMRKGVSAIQNIQLLKWCRELGVTPVWGILWGFPGEDPQEYARMAELLPLLAHLTPPIGITQIRLDRFSPNFNNVAGMGFINVKPFPSYRYVYPLDEEALRNLAYFFTYEYADGRNPSGYARPVVEAVTNWWRVHERSALFYVDNGRAMLIWDLRPVAKRHVYILTGLLRLLYLGCDKATSVVNLHKAAAAETSKGATPNEIERALAVLLDSGLLIRDGQLYLSLAVPLGECALSEQAILQFEEVIDELGETAGDDAIIHVQALSVVDKTDDSSSLSIASA